MPNATQYIHSIESANGTYEFADNLVRQYIEQHYDSTQSVAKYVNGLFGIQFPEEYLPYLLKIVVDDRIEYQFIYNDEWDRHLFVGVADSDVIGLIRPWQFESDSRTATLIGQTSSQDSLKIQFIFNNIIDSAQFITNTYSNQIPLSADRNSFYPVVVDNIFYASNFGRILPNNYYFFGGDCSAVIGGSEDKVVSVELGTMSLNTSGLAVVNKNIDINTILQNKTLYLKYTEDYQFVVNVRPHQANLFFTIISEEYLLNSCNRIEELMISIPVYDYYINWKNSSPINVGVANGLVPLNSSGKIDTQYLPSYVDDVIELKTIAASAPATCSEGDLYYNTTSHVIFEAVDTDTWGQTGTAPEAGKIYVDNTTNDIYRWGGSDLIKISNPTIPVQDVQVDGSSVVNSSGIAAISVTGKANKSEMSITAGTGANADKTTIQLKEGTSATVLTAHQDISGKQDVISNTVNVTTDSNDTTTRASFNSTTKQFTFYNLKGAAGTNGQDAHTKFVTMYSYQRLLNGVGETENNEVKLTWVEDTPPTSGTYVEDTLIEHCYLKSWVGTTEPATSTPDKQAVDANLNTVPVNTSPDLLGVSWAIQQILDGNVTTTSND